MQWAWLASGRSWDFHQKLGSWSNKKCGFEASTSEDDVWLQTWVTSKKCAFFELQNVAARGQQPIFKQEIGVLRKCWFCPELSNLVTPESYFSENGNPETKQPTGMFMGDVCNFGPSNSLCFRGHGWPWPMARWEVPNLQFSGQDKSRWVLASHPLLYLPVHASLKTALLNSLRSSLQQKNTRTGKVFLFLFLCLWRQIHPWSNHYGVLLFFSGYEYPSWATQSPVAVDPRTSKGLRRRGRVPETKTQTSWR